MSGYKSIPTIFFWIKTYKKLQICIITFLKKSEKDFNEILISTSQRLTKVHFYFPSSFSSQLSDYSIMICALYAFEIEVLLKIKYNGPGGLDNSKWHMNHAHLRPTKSIFQCSEILHLLCRSDNRILWKKKQGIVKLNTKSMEFNSYLFKFSFFFF